MKLGISMPSSSRINKALDVKEDMGIGEWNLNYAKKELEKKGFEIIKFIENFPKLRFYDIEALIYYLKAVP